MDGNGATLRSLVDKWLAPTLSMPARITHVGRLLATHSRYVQCESMKPGGLTTIVFFRHEDGSWCVFPPVPAAPAMCGRVIAQGGQR